MSSGDASGSVRLRHSWARKILRFESFGSLTHQAHDEVDNEVLVSHLGNLSMADAAVDVWKVVVVVEARNRPPQRWRGTPTLKSPLSLRLHPLPATFRRVRGDMVILKSYNRANLTTPPLKHLSDVPKTPKMSVWVHRGHTH